MDDSRRCTGTSRQSGEQCRRARCEGLDKCSLHCGLSEADRERAAGEHRLMSRSERMIKARYEDADPVTNPLEVVQRLSRVALLWLEHATDLMEGLNGTFRYEGKLKGEQLRSEVALFERAMDRAQKFSMDLIKADIDKRCVRIQESVARAVATVCRSKIGFGR